MRDVVAAGLQIVGGCLVVGAAFLASPLLGVAVAGVVVVLVGVGLES
jgi:hypothetical protein